MERDSYTLEQLLRAKIEADLSELGLTTRASEGMVACDLLYITKRSLKEVDSRVRDALSNAAEALHYARNRCALLSFDDIAAELGGKKKGSEADAQTVLHEALLAYARILDPRAIIVLEANELEKIKLPIPVVHIPNFIAEIDNVSAQKSAWQLMKKAGYLPISS